VPDLKAIKVKKSDTTYLRSMLKWTKADLYYEFSLQDLETIDLKTGKNTKVGVPEVKFKVDFHGNFLGRLSLKRQCQYEGYSP
jgi:hypothetical protein